jgi:two-component system chemotaxis response regulator CheB
MPDRCEKKDQWSASCNLHAIERIDNLIPGSRMRDIIVIGASAGGLEAVGALLAQLPADLDAALFVVIHTSPQDAGEQSRLLARTTPLKVRQASHGATIYHGNVYVARPDHHLVLEPDRMVVARGPKENRSRPAIDPLFRSAAAIYGARVIGVLLTGYLDDGVAGLAAIHRRGGVTVVQDPADADVPQMPEAALARVDVHHCVPVHRMGSVVVRATTTGAPEGGRPGGDEPVNLRIERRIAAGEEVEMDAQESLGEPAGFGCPECGGPLRRIHDPDVRRYRCHIGHAYTDRALISDQSEQVERALAAALRTLQERARLLDDLGRDAQHRQHEQEAQGLYARADEAREHAQTLRHIVLDGAEDREDDGVDENPDIGIGRRGRAEDVA